MKIQNDITHKPNIITFNGEEYDLQLNMYVVSQFEDFNDVLNSMGKVETVFKMLTVMMNSDTKRRKLERPLLDADYVAACTSMTDMPIYTKAIATALGFKEPTKADEELDALADSEGAPDIKN